MGLLKSLLFTSTCLAAAIAPQSSAQPSLARRDSGTCDGGPWEAVQESGNESIGTAFCESGWGADYVPVTGIETWSNEDYISGIAIHYANGAISNTYGVTSGSLHQLIVIDYAQGQTWTGFDLYTDPNSPTLNALDLHTSNGHELYAGAQPGRLSPSASHTAQALGSGILLGVTGTSDDVSVRSLGGLFLASPIASIRIDNINFPYGPGTNQGISINDVATSHYYNGQTTGTSMWSFTNTEAFATTQAFTQGTTNTYGMTETITFGLNLMVVTASSATAFTWSTAYMQSSTNTVSQTVTVSWAESGTLQPQTGVDCVAFVGEGQATFPYTSTVTIKLQSGYSFSFTEDGSLTVNDVSQAVVTVTDDNNPQ